MGLSQVIHDLTPFSTGMQDLFKWSTPLVTHGSIWVPKGAREDPRDTAAHSCRGYRATTRIPKASTALDMISPMHLSCSLALTLSVVHGGAEDAEKGHWRKQRMKPTVHRLDSY